jgi:hypothetical protein
MISANGNKKKILFIWNGMTHYFNLITSKINEQPGIEIIYLSPEVIGQSIGAGFSRPRRAPILNAIR